MATIKDSLNGLIEVKLGSCFTGPMKRLVADLHASAKLCNLACNVMASQWWHWRWENPDWQPEQRCVRGQPKWRKDSEGEILRDEEGKPVPFLEEGFISQQCEKAMYDLACREAYPLAAQIISTLRNKVQSDLTTKLPYNRLDKSLRQKWEGVLAHQQRLTLWKRPAIPLPTSCTAVSYAGKVSAGKGVPKETRRGRSREGTVAHLQQKARAGFLLRFVLFAAGSGRRIDAPVVSLQARQLPRGHRRVLQRIAAGEWKLRDSQLVFKRGEWYAQLCYRQPSKRMNLDPKTVAMLWPLPADASMPFLLEIDEERRMHVGYGRDLVREYQRLEARRLALRNRYHDQTSGVKGHGRGRFELRMRPESRITQDAQSRFWWKMIQQILRFCRQYDCGKIIYREPDMGLREHSWFAKAGVPMDWTGGLAKLQFKMESYGIVLEAVPCSVRDLRNRFEVEPARVSHPALGKEVRNGKPKEGRYRGVQKIEPLAEGANNGTNSGSNSSA